MMSQWGYTPLHWAASCWGHGNIAALLLKAGADANLVNKVILGWVGVEIGDSV